MEDREEPARLPFSDGADYESATFERVVAAGSLLSAIQFTDCRFAGASFAVATLHHCVFDGCRFEDCDLSNAKVTNARFVDTSFTRCKLIGVDWTLAGDATASRLGLSVVFENCVLDYGTFFGLDLRETRFSECSAKEVDFGEARLSGVDCSGTDFTRAKFQHTDLTRADFRGARNYRISPTANTVKKARFSLPDALALLAEFDVTVE